MQDGILIGEICRQARCTPRTVRHYEAEGLVSPVATTPGGRKLYGKHTVSIIRTAQLFKLLGCSLKDIRRILALTKSGSTQNRRLSKRLRKVLSETISSMDSEMERLISSRREMADLLEETECCEACVSTDCEDCEKLKNLRTLGLLEQNLKRSAV